MGAALAVALIGLGGCGDDPQPLVEPPPPGKPASLIGTWNATQSGGYKLSYVFRRDGTYRHSSGVRQKREAGEYIYAISARGSVAIRGRTLVLRPRGGTIELHDPGDPSGDFKRPLDKRPQRYEWSVRGIGRDAKLTLTIGGALGVTYRRR